MWRTLPYLPVAALALGLWFAASTAQAEELPDDLLVIVNTAAGAASLSTAEIQSLFLKVRTAFPHSGKKVVPVHAKEATKLRTAFQIRVLGMSPEKEGRYWQDQKVKFGIDKPVEFTNPQMAVFKLSGAISYVLRRDYKPGVTAIVAVFPASQ